MNLTIITGSHRPESQSAKVGEYIQKRIQTLQGDIETHILDLGKNPLPFWDEGMWRQDPQWDEAWGPVKDLLQHSDGFIIVAPEWGGMVPAALKNFFLLASPHELGDKPGLIVTVSASRGGAYPVSELRMSSYKNTRICYLPEHVIVRDVEKVLNNQEFNPEDKSDFYLKTRMDYALKVLMEYTKALSGVRASGVVDYKAFPNGM